MQRIPLIEPQHAQGRTQELFELSEKLLGAVPNNVQTAANSPAALEGLLGMFASLSQAEIGGRLQAQILLAVSETNVCTYCVALLTSSLGPKAGLTAEEMLAGRRGTAVDQRSQLALNFASAVLQSHGQVEDADIAAVRAGGFTNQHIVEIIATVALGCFTNFLNNVADTTLDFPLAMPLASLPA